MSLIPIKQKANSVNLWSVDTEDDSKGNVILIGFYDGENYISFDNQESAIEFLLNLPSKKNIYIWATNLMYDLVNIFYGYFDLLEVIFNGSYIAVAKLKGTNIYFCDTLNHSKISVKDAGKLVGLKKLAFNPNSTEYNKRDCVITYMLMKNLEKYYNELNANLKFTIASTALDLFRRNFLRMRINRPDDDIINKLKPAYYGGRCEIFQCNEIKGNIFYYDINSLYPYIMKNTKYPNPNHFKYYDSDKNFSLDNFGIAYVTVKTSDSYLPLLPYKTDKGKLIFPNGVISGCYAIPELKQAINLGYKILKVHYHIKYDYGDYYFRDYVDTLYQHRRETDNKIMNMVCKILMNSLYGKFAQGNEFYELIPFEQSDGDSLYCLDNMVFQKRVGDYPRHSNFIWSIYTTAYARLYLYEYLNYVHTNNYNLLYCDTDSVIYEGQKLFDVSSELGGLKLEGKFDTAQFVLPKMYMLKNKKHEVYTAKGIPKYLSKEFHELGKVVYERPIKLREGIRRGLKPNVWTKHTKENRGQYDKRKILYDGSTYPLTIDA